MLPLCGPQVFSVAGVDAAIAAGATLGPIPFRFPRAVFVVGALLLPTSGVRADMASLRLRIQDESYAELLSDARGGVDAPALAVSGTTLLAGTFSDLMATRPFVLQRPVVSGDIWTVSVRNVGAVELRGELLFFFEEPTS